MQTFIRKSSAIYLAFIILLRVMAMPLSLLDYSLHREYIATHLCENRSNLEIHCGGTCFLHKQLTKSSENPAESGNQKGNTKILIIDFLETHHGLSLGGMVVSSEYKMDPKPDQLTDPLSGNIFHPPIA
jgi:hypothetical protein